MAFDYKENFGVFKDALRNKGHAEVELDRAAADIGQRFMREIWAVQPVGGPDPMPGRSTRPSIRQKHSPIERGWLGSPRIQNVGPATRTIEIVSESPHVTFFTMWAGRPYLGTRPGADIIAVDAERLAFWWMGAARFPKKVEGQNRKGFVPATDFMQAAFAKTEPFIWNRIRDVATFTLDKQFENLT